MKVIEDKGEYILAQYDEEYSKNVLFEFIQEVHQKSQEANCYKLLGDISNMTGTVGMMDRFEFGVKGAAMFRKGYKIALVYRAEEITGFAENVSVNRGLKARIFSKMEAAMEWLLS